VKPPLESQLASSARLDDLAGPNVQSALRHVVNSTFNVPGLQVPAAKKHVASMQHMPDNPLEDYCVQSLL
jgi:hypothetical protein